MPNTPAEPTNIVLEQLRQMRAENAAFRTEVNARFDKVDERFGRVEADIADIKRDMRGLKLNTIAEVYKANLPVARFIDLERRVEALERKAPS